MTKDADRPEITERQREARAANARDHSTGPTSAPGKARSSRNAIKHGGYSKPDRVRDRAQIGGYENELAELRTAVEAELRPATALQNEIADNLAATFFQARRLSYLGAATLAPVRLLGHLEAGQLDHLGLTTVLEEASMYSHRSSQLAVAAQAVRSLAKQDLPTLRMVAAELADLGSVGWPEAWSDDGGEGGVRLWARRNRDLLEMLEITKAAAAEQMLSRSDHFAALARTRLEYAEMCAGKALLDSGAIENLLRAQNYNLHQVRGFLNMYRAIAPTAEGAAGGSRNELTEG